MAVRNQTAESAADLATTYYSTVLRNQEKAVVCRTQLLLTMHRRHTVRQGGTRQQVYICCPVSAPNSKGVTL